MSTSVELSSPITSQDPHQDSERNLLIAFAGNPNAGKTTLFNCVTGLRQKVANFPGVTVERKEGSWHLPSLSRPARIIDLPGLYSLDAASADEQIARDVITGSAEGLGTPDVVIAVVDATNLERNLYLVTQLMEYGRPIVVALTMMDLAAKRKLGVDQKSLSEQIGLPVIAVNAARREGMDQLAKAVVNSIGKEGAGASWPLSESTETEIDSVMRSAESKGKPISRRQVVRMLFSEDGQGDRSNREEISTARARLSAKSPGWWQEPLIARYEWIENVCRKSQQRSAEDGSNVTEKIDWVLTHRVYGPLVLVAVMLLVFQTIFSWASLPMDLIDHGFKALGDIVSASLPPGLFSDLLVNGVIAGVGGVIVFLPQILLLFFFISVLEDTGYMARAAFIMDRLMRGVGLHGKAFMPLLSSFACAIPGIMATRTIENPKDRLATIMIAPFMSCSARLPVYTLMIAAFFSGRYILGVVSVGALMIMGMYLLGITVAICVAWILKRTILKAPTPPLVLELPPYRLPNFKTILYAMITRAGLFLRRAGTVILAISIILWALATFPRTTPAATSSGTLAEQDVHGEQLRNSFAGMGGRALEPIIRPLGFDWKMGVALISSFAARETLVSTLSIIYNVGDDADSSSDSLIGAVKEAKRPDGTPAWTPLVAFSMMVFFVLAMQCMSTMAIVRRETNSWRWPLFMFSYMTVLAWVASFITYQGGRLFGFH